jgi:glycosyltransferase involved in cell wall biosynthesis
MVIKVASLLINRKDIVFQMIGSGTFEKEFKTYAFENKLSNIQFFPWQDLKIISDVYSSSTIGFIPLSKNVLGNSHPSKASLLMACKKTFVTSTYDDSLLYSNFNKNKLAICVPENDPAKVSNAILKLIDNPLIRLDYENNAYLYASKFLSSNYNIKKFILLIDDIVSKNQL